MMALAQRLVSFCSLCAAAVRFTVRAPMQIFDGAEPTTEFDIKLSADRCVSWIVLAGPFRCRCVPRPRVAWGCV